jgi:hypothetical protein
MSAVYDLAKNKQIWGTFENLREHLFDQFQNVSYDSKTGLSIDDLEQKIDDYIRSYPEAPRVLQKANIFRIIMEYGQIYIDPLDWFADKLNHGGLLAKIRNGWHRDIENGVIKDAASYTSPHCQDKNWAFLRWKAFSLLVMCLYCFSTYQLAAPWHT